jgi:DNA-binding transcriptional ArsR family regulator
VPRAATTTDVFNAIAEERRRDLLITLGAAEVGVDELVSRLHLAQPQVSKHLKVLREVGLVRCRTVGRRRLYRVHQPAMQPFRDWLRHFETLVNEQYDRLDDHLVEMQVHMQQEPH